ncbi:MAG: acetoacetate decarboxylase family protein [Actinomycetota bacterium]
MEDFFEGIEQVEARFNGGVGEMPVFWRDSRAFGAILPASWLKLKRVLPDARMAPAQIFPGIGGVVLAAYEYADSSIGPYNEFSVGILLNSPLHIGVPGYNLLRQYLDGFLCAYIYHLPVTTEVAPRAGKDYYGFPKFVADIDFSDTHDSIRCDLSHDGERIITMSGRKLPGRNMGEMTIMGNLYQYRTPQYAEIKADVIEGAIAPGPGNFDYEVFRSHPVGRDTAELILAPRAIGYLYISKLQAVLYGPERLQPPLLKHVLATAKVLPG